MRTIYALSRGDYDEYRLIAVTETRAAAEHLAARVNASPNNDYDASVEVTVIPYVDDVATIEKVSPLRLLADVWDDGRPQKTPNEQVDTEWPFDMLYPQHAAPVYVRWVRAPIHRDQAGRLEVSGTDHDLVRRTFDEQILRLRTDPAYRNVRLREGHPA